MKRTNIIFFGLLYLIILSGCQTIKEKSDLIVENENEKLSQYIGRDVSDLKMNLGKPTDDYKNEKGNLELIYKTKKYGLPCERKFEIDSNSTVIGFVSKGCF